MEADPLRGVSVVTFSHSPAPETGGRRWVSQTEAAEYLGITDRTLRRMIAAGRLPAYRLGPRLLRIDVADLDALMRPVPVGGVHV